MVLYVILHAYQIFVNNQHSLVNLFGWNVSPSLPRSSVGTCVYIYNIYALIFIFITFLKAKLFYN